MKSQRCRSIIAICIKSKDNEKAEGCRLFAASEPKKCIFRFIHFKQQQQQKLITDFDNQKNAEYQISASNWSTPIYSIHICKYTIYNILILRFINTLGNLHFFQSTSLYIFFWVLQRCL